MPQRDYKYTYKCSSCGQVIHPPIQPLEDPVCSGKKTKHTPKDMKFVPEQSTDTPRYLQKEKKK